MSDNITLPREVVEKIHEAWSSEVYPPAASTEWYDIMDALRAALAAPEPSGYACWACNGKGCLRDIDTAGLLPCVVCKPQEDKT